MMIADHSGSGVWLRLYRALMRRVRMATMSRQDVLAARRELNALRDEIERLRQRFAEMELMQAELRGEVKAMSDIIGAAVSGSLGQRPAAGPARLTLVPPAPSPRDEAARRIIPFPIAEAGPAPSDDRPLT